MLLEVEHTIQIPKKKTDKYENVNVTVVVHSSGQFH
jgi:hypothetical protein